MKLIFVFFMQFYEKLFVVRQRTVHGAFALRENHLAHPIEKKKAKTQTGYTIGVMIWHSLGSPAPRRRLNTWRLLLKSSTIAAEGKWVPY